MKNVLPPSPPWLQCPSLPEVHHGCYGSFHKLANIHHSEEVGRILSKEREEILFYYLLSSYLFTLLRKKGSSPPSDCMKGNTEDKNNEVSFGQENNSCLEIPNANMHQ